MLVQFAGKVVDLSRLHVMGVLNVTPDSFSDGGQYSQIDDALSQVEKMVAQGASFVDVGGESTRPGASEVSVQQEIDRVVPVIEKITANFDVVVSIDTSKPEVMEEACLNGVGLINDVRALREPGALSVASASGVPVCLMHMQGQPRVMQENPSYSDVVSEVSSFLEERIKACLDAGIGKDQILLDPGFGFGKKLQHNLALMKTLNVFSEFGCPLLVGVSRKTMLGEITGKNVDGRLAASLAAATYAAINGAAILRVHDVDQTVDALKVVQALRDCGHG